MKDQNVRISGETHALASEHVRKNGKLLGKFVEKAIIEKIEREEKPFPLKKETKG